MLHMISSMAYATPNETRSAEFTRNIYVGSSICESKEWFSALVVKVWRWNDVARCFQAILDIRLRCFVRQRRCCRHADLISSTARSIAAGGYRPVVVKKLALMMDTRANVDQVNSLGATTGCCNLLWQVEQNIWFTVK